MLEPIGDLEPLYIASAVRDNPPDGRIYVDEQRAGIQIAFDLFRV